MKHLLFYLLILVFFGSLTAVSVFVVSSPWVFQALFLFVHGEGASNEAQGIYTLAVPFWEMFISTSANSQLLTQELSHLEDVKGVLSGLFGFGFAGIVVLIFTWKSSRSLLVKVIRTGIKIGIGITSALLAIAALHWNWFFTQFHRLFFAEGTWQFPAQSVLIQLFPQQFWISYGIAFVIVFLFTLCGLWIITRSWVPKRKITETDHLP